VLALAISSDGARLATASNHRVQMWDLRRGAISWEQRAAAWLDPVRGVAFSPDGTRLATGSKDKAARIRDVITGYQQLEVKHSNNVTAVAFSPDGTRLATGSKDKTARIWDVTVAK